ncbi:MAG: DegT/DnrJ/EryC1/StrS family aminotransferase [Rhodocyclaceae bacterium]|nr:DegT/DnrJ/EryC1/StrS family aminotransferase [Rhodocyclaceae bacterium]
MSWQIPLFDPDFDEREEEAVASVIRSKWLTMGERTSRFEARFAEFCGSRHALAVSNCTAALHLALMALGIGPGDEVIVPALTFVATANAVRYCGATPVFADVSSLDEWNLSAASIEPLLTDHSRAIIVVHYAGYPCDMPGITALARQRGIPVVEDVAHAPGASLEGRAMGAWGDVGCFSFFSNKNMTTGEGGMVTTDRDDLAELLRRTRSHGMTTLTLERHKGHAFSYDVVELGYNYRMSELNAALGLCQLERLPESNRRRAAHVARYRELLCAIPGLQVPFSRSRGEPAFHIMPVLLPTGANRVAIMQAMKEAGVQTSIHYRPVDSFSAYVAAGLGPSPHVPLTHDIGARTLTLPLFPSMNDAQVEHVCASLSLALSAQN